MWPLPRRVEPAPSRVDRLVYAVGDVHGRSDLLDLLLLKVLQDVLAHPELRPALVFVGDLIDRGGDSAGVIERLIELEGWRRAELVCLRGNHEATLQAFLDDAEYGPTWLRYGGGRTLQSYGVPAPHIEADPAEWEAVRMRLLSAMPRSHRAFLGRMPLYAEFGDYLFVHAGVRPGVPLEAQTEKDLLWIRKPFLKARQPFDRVVVHGHTPARDVFMGRHRIGIDTGAYASGILSAVRLCGETREIVQADGQGE